MSLENARAFGAQVQAGGGTVFRLWAPGAQEVDLELDPQGAPSEHAMHPAGDGWHEVRVAGVGAGTRYQFAVDGATPVPDPASRYNPLDVHGPSEVVDSNRFQWTDADWRGRPW